MEEEKVEYVKNMTEEEFEAKKTSVNNNILDIHFKVKEEVVDFDQDLYEQNLKELQDIGYNFETEYEEGEENAYN